MTTSIPAATLTVLGALLVVVGLFLAGSLEIIVLGMAGLVVAAVVEAFGRRRA